MSGTTNHFALQQSQHRMSLWVIDRHAAQSIQFQCRLSPPASAVKASALKRSRSAASNSSSLSASNSPGAPTSRRRRCRSALYPSLGCLFLRFQRVKPFRRASVSAATRRVRCPPASWRGARVRCGRRGKAIIRARHVRGKNPRASCGSKDRPRACG